MNKERNKKVNNDDKLNLQCAPPNNNKKANNPKTDSKGSHKAYKEPKIENTQTDVYYDTECKLPDSEVAIPTYDAVVEAKEWVDKENKM